MLVRNPCVSDARVLREAGALATAGHEVTIVAVLEPGLEADEEKAGFRIRRIDPIPRWQRNLSRALGGKAAGQAGGSIARAERVTRRPWLRTLMYDRAVSASFTRAARGIVANVYHAHDLNMLGPALDAARHKDAAVVYDAHELYPELNGLSPRERARWGRAERRLIGKAERVITVNDSLAAELVRRYAIPVPTVVRNTPDPASARPDLHVDALSRPGRKILYIGWIVPGRGIEQALEALTYLEEGVLILLGSDRGGHAERLRVRAEELGVADRFAFAGPVPPEDVVEVAADATIGLCTIRNVGLSYYLSLPNKVFEYIHAGLPVVVSDFPELRGLVETFGLGATCDPDDPRSIAKAIDIVSTEPAHARMRDGARRAARVLTWSKESTKLIDLYARLGTP
jgi:glycosyltransferase involved in cell wall biosynthesis